VSLFLFSPHYLSGPLSRLSLPYSHDSLPFGITLGAVVLAKRQCSVKVLLYSLFRFRLVVCHSLLWRYCFPVLIVSGNCALYFYPTIILEHPLVECSCRRSLFFVLVKYPSCLFLSPGLPASVAIQLSVEYYLPRNTLQSFSLLAARRLSFVVLGLPNFVPSSFAGLARIWRNFGFFFPNRHPFSILFCLVVSLTCEFPLGQ
jgi:hypothetical protein